MTLLLTELSPLGIAMAADSAVTVRNQATGLTHAKPNAARKLQVVPHVTAGVSCWGLGSIGGTPTDQWLSHFIADSTSLSTLQALADELAERLNKVVPSNKKGTNRLGFHIAAFENHHDTPTPSFYHVHDGPSTALQKRGVSVDPHRFNANHDMPPSKFQSMVRAGEYYITRNGDYHLYARMFQLLEKFFAQLQPMGIRIPCSQDLRDRAEYLVFQIRTMSELYRLSNLVPGIGGRIDYLTISPDGIHSQGVRHF